MDSFRTTEAEIKIILSGAAAKDACRSLRLEPGDGKRLSVYFWDTPRADGDRIRLPMADAGTIIRLRRPAKGDKGDFTVKLRPCDPAALPPQWRDNRDGKGWQFKIEEDWNGLNRVVAASLKVDGDFERPVDDEGNGPTVRPPLTPDQHDLLASAGVGDDELRHAVALGPVQAVKWKPSRQDLVHPLTAELWSVGDNGPRFLELSLHARQADAPHAQELLERTVRERGLKPAPQQASKTETVMTELARNHLRRTV
ncbi:hypothetical protein [Streptomyces cinnamoneus]|uniref:hypothetical protein n=1 Tax=Streptomyces cinnamoneus TaxID=53446 RepID=UPI0037948A79